eukprot:9490158-Pyramimonas_sp.AAC.1
MILPVARMRPNQLPRQGLPGQVRQQRAAWRRRLWRCRGRRGRSRAPGLRHSAPAFGDTRCEHLPVRDDAQDSRSVG